MSKAVCRYWQSTGNCFYGDQCNFSHTREGPSSPATAANKAASNVVPKSQRPCRNIALHGTCRFEGKGCEFNHNVQSQPNGPKSSSLQVGGSTQGSPTASPKSDTYGSAPQSPNFPVQSGDNHSGGPPSMLPPQATNQSYNVPPIPFSAPMQPVPGGFAPVFRPNVVPDYTGYGILQSAAIPNQNGPQGFQQFPMPMGQQPRASPQGTRQVPMGIPRPAALPMSQPPSGHQRRTFNPYSSNPKGRTFNSLFVAEDRREELQHRNAIRLATLDESDPRYRDVPLQVNHYHSLFPLDVSGSRSTGLFGITSQVYKAINSHDGIAYFLRKLDNFRPANDLAMGAIEAWKGLRHPGIVGVKELFTSKDFPEKNSLVFVYDFYPGAQTIEQLHLSQATGMLSESVLWSYICQLVCAIRAVHSAGYACRTVETTRILVTNKSRVHIGCCGLLDVLKLDGNKTMQELQYEDLVGLGKVILSLACNSSNSLHNLPASLDYVHAHYSPDLKNLVVYLLTKPQGMNIPSIFEVCGMVGPRMATELDNTYRLTDSLEHELTREMENGRLARLLVKLGFVNERPEYDMDPGWSETGDRYLLKLFRDYVFHQVDENNCPVVDYGHVVETLNKLDVGVGEKMTLMSRDERSILVVSYADLKKCLESSFRELRDRVHPLQ